MRREHFRQNRRCEIDQLEPQRTKRACQKSACKPEEALAGKEASGFYLVLLITAVAAAIGVWFLRRIDWL